jgi:hypothetical protein
VYGRLDDLRLRRATAEDSVPIRARHGANPNNPTKPDAIAELRTNSGGAPALRRDAAPAARGGLPGLRRAHRRPLNDRPSTSRQARRPRELPAACGLLLTLLCAAYANIVFGGRSLVYTDNFNFLGSPPLGVTLEPESVWTERNLSPSANFHDPGAVWWQWEPAAEYLRDGLARGEWPWWDPHVGAGAPAMANLTPTFFFPPYLLVIALGNGAQLKNLYFLALLLAAGVSSFALLRRHGLTFLAALCGGAAVIFCGGLAQNVGSFIGQTAALVPGALLLTRWFLENPSWRRTAILACGYAGIALSSFPPLLLAGFGLSALYAAVIVAAHADRGLRSGRFAIATALALCLVAFAYLPAIAAAHSAPQFEVAYAGAGLQTIQWRALLQLLSPTVAGDNKVLLSSPVYGTDITLPYAGTVALLLAALATPPPRRDAALFCKLLAAAAILVVLKLLGVEPLQSIGRLPGFDHIHFAHYYGIVLDLLLCLLAGFGAHRLETEGPRPWRLLIVGSGLAAVLAALYVIAEQRGVLSHRSADDWRAAWYVVVATLAIAVALAAVAAGGGASSALRRRCVVIGLFALIAAEGVHNTYYPRQNRWNLWRHPARYVEELLRHRDRGRILTYDRLHANAASAFELYSLDSLMTFNPQRTFELYRRYLSPDAFLFQRQARLLPPEGVLDAANIGVVAARLSNKPLLEKLAARRYDSLWTDGDTILLARPVPERCFFTSQYRQVSSESALASLGEPRAEREILTEVPLPSASVGNSPADPKVEARIARNRVTLRVVAPRPGAIYCSEANAKGWRATVNGEAATILEANYAFRAIPVPAGHVVVEMCYWPPGLGAGLLLGLFGLGAIAILAVRREPVEIRLVPRAQRWLPEPWPRRAMWLCAVTLSTTVTVAAAQRYWFSSAPHSTAAPAHRSGAFYRIEWGDLQPPPHWHAGETVPLQVSVRNAGREAWPHQAASEGLGDGSGHVRVSYRWLPEIDGPPVIDYAARFDLPGPLWPGASTTIEMAVATPPRAGIYRLQVDLVDESVAWFESKGAAVLVVRVVVEP